MDLLQLEHFLAVAEEGNFTRAAERVGRTQSAVSLSVKKLEDELGTLLFARDSPALSMTSAGKILAESAGRMLKTRDAAVHHIQLQNQSSGSLAIAAHESAALYLLPSPLGEFFRRYPLVTVGISRSRPEDIPNRVLDGEVDIGFVKERPTCPELRSAVVHTDEMVLIASPRHQLVGRRAVHITDLSREPFIVHHQCSSTEQYILRLFADNHVRCRIAAELWSFENVKDFVRQDLGLAIVPRICADADLRRKSLARLPLKTLRLRRETVMVFRDQRLTDAAQNFVGLMNDVAARTVPA
jgi:DNA-binding transcriptional LysR family regulator